MPHRLFKFSLGVAALVVVLLGCERRDTTTSEPIIDRLGGRFADEISKTFPTDPVAKHFDGAMSTKMLRGDMVSVATQLRFGLVSVNGGCSGVLLNNQWALTAGHCFNAAQFRTATVTLNGVSRASSHVYVFSSETNPSPPFPAGSVNARGPDMALVRLTTPFAINGSTTGFRNAIGRATTSGLGDRLTLVYGQGINQLGSGISPASGAGTFRFGLLQITKESAISFREPRLEAKPIFNPGPVCAFGDSGGPMFVVEGGEYQIVSVVETGDMDCTAPGPCTAANTTAIRSCKGPKVAEFWGSIQEITAMTWNTAAAFQLFDIGGAEFVDMQEINGEVNVDQQPWAASARSANKMCFNRGFTGGHFNGHQLRDRFGLACAGNSGATFRDATSAEIAGTPWPFTDVNTATWAQANRAAARLCEQGGLVGGHFNGNMILAPGGGKLAGLICYRAPAKRADTTVADVAGPWQFSDVNSVTWARAARAANDYCQRLQFSTGFMTGHSLPNGRLGVVCH